MTRNRVSSFRQFLAPAVGALAFFFLLRPLLHASESLKPAVDELLSRSGLKSALTSIQIVSLPDGRVLYEKNPNLALNPASNVKLVTMAAALHDLGPLFTYRTEFFSGERIDGEGVIGDLWIKGYGDPSLFPEDFRGVAAQLRASGLRKIEGDLVIDDTYFDRNHLLAYTAEAEAERYRIVTGPLAFRTRASGKNLAAPVCAGVMPDPAVTAGTAFRKALQAEGISVRGGCRREVLPENLRLLLLYRSRPLKEILKALGKFSDNFAAEQLLKTLGAAALGPPGTVPKGLAALESYLEGLGLQRDSYTLDNGSGLTHLSSLSSAHFVKILFDLYTSPWREDVFAALAVSGTDGTLSGKLGGSGLRGKVFAKTGTLNNVSALSGYVVDGKKRIAFSFLFNDLKASLSEVTRVEEKILETVLESSYRP